MKLITKLLLASAAMVVGAAGAHAADLPTKKAAPVEYVRICSVFGPGFFYIPGSDTCIKIGGHSRFAFVSAPQYNKSVDNSSFRAEGRISFDAITQTDWGALRAFMRFDFRRDSGTAWFGSGSRARAAMSFQFSGPASGFPSFAGADTVGNRLQTGLNIDTAFVQWGGLTAGRIQSFFDFYADADTWFGIATSDVITQALAYTYTFGSGFSATLSLEDPKERQKYPVAGVAPVESGGINPTVATPPFTNVYPFAFSPFAAPLLSPGGINYTQRETVPDVVGVLRVDQDWGSAQLSGAYHRVSTSGSTIVNLQPAQIGGVLTGGVVLNPIIPTVSGGYGQVAGNGWAFQGGVKINLPMIAAGDHLYMQAAYSKGEIGYVNSGFPGWYSASAYAATQYDSLPAYDAVVGPTGRIQLTPAWSALFSYEHYWTPTIRQALFGSVAHVSYSSSIRTAAGFAQGAACPTCVGTVVLALPGGATPYNPFSIQYDGGTSYYLGSNLIWSPIKNLDIGVEGFYALDELAHKQWDPNRGNGRLLNSASQWLTQLRITRAF